MKCNKCQLDKKLSEFNKDKKAPTGYRRTCKECDRLAIKDYYKRNSETIKRKARERYRKSKNERG